MRRRILATAGALILFFCAHPGLAQTDAPAFFKQNCTSCHTIGGGRLTGPDLKDVTQQKDKAWLTEFIQNPKAKIDAGDPYVLKLQQEARGVVMPTLAGMNPQMASALIDLIEAESKLPRSQFAGSQISDRPFTPQDVALGRAIFEGDRRLAAGGPPCISCHTVRGLGGLGGGHLGPDLTLVYERLQGRKGLGAWLGAPMSPTMQPVFRTKPINPDETLALLAFFEDEAKKGGVDDSPSLLNFFLLGLGGTVISMVAFDAVYKRRLRGVRRPMVHGNKVRGQQ
jgi:mono/diheme cytochrome c family protein